MHPIRRARATSWSVVSMIACSALTMAGAVGAADPVSPPPSVGVVARTATAAEPLRLILFGVGASRSFNVLKNGTLFEQSSSSAAGALRVADRVIAGDRFEAVETGGAQPPPPPLLAGVSQVADGCMSVEWLPSGSPDVVGYVVDYGRYSVQQGEALDYEFSIDPGATTSAQACLLAEGIWYAAVRSRNYLGQLSAFSAEGSEAIVPTTVAFANVRARRAGGGVDIRWDVAFDEPVDAFDVYRTELPDGEDPRVSVRLTRDRELSPSARSYRDTGADETTAYAYVVVAHATGGVGWSSPSIRVAAVESGLGLEQNVPNPFNPTTAIAFSVPRTTRVSLTVYDARGVTIRTLANGLVSAGRHRVPWDGTDSSGRRAASGVYFYRLIAGGAHVSRKMILLK